MGVGIIVHIAKMRAGCSIKSCTERIGQDRARIHPKRGDRGHSLGRLDDEDTALDDLMILCSQWKTPSGLEGETRALRPGLKVSPLSATSFRQRVSVTIWVDAASSHLSTTKVLGWYSRWHPRRSAPSFPRTQSLGVLARDSLGIGCFRCTHLRHPVSFICDWRAVVSFASIIIFVFVSKCLSRCLWMFLAGHRRPNTNACCTTIRCARRRRVLRKNNVRLADDV